MNRVVVGLGSCGVAAGGREVHAACVAALESLGIDAALSSTGCIGLCYREVVVEVESEALGPCLYGDVTPEQVPDLLAAHFGDNRVLDDHLIARHGISRESAFLDPQERVVLRNCGKVDPDSIDDHLARDGYRALGRALREMTPEAVIKEIKVAGLRGRGGAGFPTGRKWELARAAAGTVKYVILNADEGDPGAFMDRNIVEGDPFGVLEGFTLAAYAIGATEGFVYVREEYPLAVERLTAAVEKARARGYLGENILGSSFSFDIHIKQGAGAFVCGEETALIASLEGRRGIPRRRPPFPVEAGLRGRPTSINNVETCANVPWILLNGAAAFRASGLGESRGTKVFSLAGDLRRTGLVEVPMGMTIRQIVDAIGGGSPSGRPIKAVQIGGPSGGCLPERLFDTPVDYESLLETGAIMGSGGFIALDETCCMVDLARYFLAFTQRESCGKCTFCRLGTTRMLEILERLCAGDGHDDDLETLEELGHQVCANSMCGLGRSAPNPALTSLQYFRDEYEAHLKGHCPAGRCRPLIAFSIDRWLCESCTKCLEQCPSEAIFPTPGAIPLSIDSTICIRCGGCRDACQFTAVQVQ